MTALDALDLVTTAIVDALDTAGLTVGDAEKPAAGGWQGTPGQSEFQGYAVVYPLWGAADGPADSVSADAHRRLQITSVGDTRAAAEAVARLARQALLAADLDVDNVKVWPVAVDRLGEATRDDTDQPAVFYVPDRFRIHVVPA